MPPPPEHMYAPAPPPPGERPGPGGPPPPPGHVYYPVIDPGLQEQPRAGTSSERERFGPAGASGSNATRDGGGGGMNPSGEMKEG